MGEKPWTSGERAAFIVALALGAFAVLYVLLGSAGVKGLFTGSDTAAWVQAFGSIGAIYGAARMTAHQIRAARLHQYEAEQRALMRRFNAIAAVVTKARQTLFEFAAAMRVSGELQRNALLKLEFDLHWCGADLANARTSELHSFWATKGLQALASSVDISAKVVKMMLKDQSDPNGRLLLAERVEARTAQGCADFEQAVKEIQEDPGIALPPRLWSLKSSSPSAIKTPE